MRHVTCVNEWCHMCSRAGAMCLFSCISLCLYVCVSMSLCLCASVHLCVCMSVTGTEGIVMWATSASFVE